MEFFDVVKNRYSCRKFTAEKVSDEKLAQILTAAQQAPTAKNSQPVKIWVIRSDDALAKIRTATPCHFNASVILVVGGRESEAFVRPSDGKNYAEIDASIVATHIMLAVEAVGLGTTWVGMFDAPKLKELFPEMSEYDLVALFPVGCKNAEPAERHFVRKSIDELCRNS